MVAIRVGVGKETAPGEQRVALVPDAVGRLRELGLEIVVESGAGTAAWHPDSAYGEAGAEVVSKAELYERADVIVTVRRPDTAALRAGQAVLGMLRPFADPGYVRELAVAGVTAIAFEGLPRTLSAAQTMDAMSSQDNIAGYKAAVLAADTYGRFFPLLVTAAGTARPAQALVLGAGVAGLQAIGTARRLGAVVTGYDIRPEAEGEITSLGAAFLRLSGGPEGSGQGGYARALTEEEQRAQQEELARHISRQDVVITTARVPGRRPPVLVTEAAVKGMRAGSVVVDMAASDLGGNVEGSRPGETVVTDGGVTIVGAAELAAAMPAAASTAYSSNVRALLGHLVRDGALAVDTAAPIQAGVVLTHAGEIVHPAFGGAS